MISDFENKETIAAIATAIAPGQGGIAIIRISGPDALEACKAIISLAGKKEWKSHQVLYGHVIEENSSKHLDEVLVLFMKAPRSFTGEDLVEIHCHGGLIVVQQVLARVLHHSSIRRALPGEFSQRAVLNDRIDLTQAEAISDLISARSQKAAELAMAGLDGGVQKRINKLRNRLLDQLSELEARIDFEDELPPLNEAEILHELGKIQHDLNKLVEDGKKSICLRQGIKVALIGCPNVGKSSLLNLLSRREKAIVTNLPGTTRDLLESGIILEGVPMTLLDTAGIRATNDEVEKLGIAKTTQAMLSADVVVLIFDLNQGWTTNDHSLLTRIPKDIPRLLVGNKADLLANKNLVGNMRQIKPDVTISSLTGEGERSFIQSLLNVCEANDTQGLQLALNERQSELAELATISLERVKEVARQELPWDFWTIDIRAAIHTLGEITGETITEEVLDRIFSRFCIGK